MSNDTAEFASFMQAVYSARKRAKDRGFTCELGEDEALALWRRCKGRCELTGIPFELGRPDGCIRRPFAPSIDRVDASKPYTKDNTRVVCTSVNLAMNQWGDGVLYRIARGLSMNPVKWRAAGNRWKDHPEPLPRGVKIAYMTHSGPKFSGSKVISGKRFYTGIYTTVSEVLEELATLKIPATSLGEASGEPD
jgi:hypothetical protein